MRYEELTIEGRNAVLEAFRSGKPIDRLFVLDGCQDGPVKTIVREAKKTGYGNFLCFPGAAGFHVGNRSSSGRYGLRCRL